VLILLVLQLLKVLLQLQQHATAGWRQLLRGVIIITVKCVWRYRILQQQAGSRTNLQLYNLYSSLHDLYAYMHTL
jgi:hypothetical protein